MSDLPFMTSKTLLPKRWQYSYLAFFAHGYSPRVHFAARSRFAPRVLRWKTLTRFLSSAPLRVRIPLRWAQKGKAPIAGSLFNQVVGDEGCPRAAGAARSRFGPAALACYAGKRFAFPQLRTLAGSNPSAMGQNKNGPLARTVSNSVVGDEGFEPPALCV